MSAFKRMVSRLPWSMDTIIGEGIAFFVSEQDPEEVSFDTYNNGYVIKVKTDEDNVKEAAKFWKKNVEDKL